MIKTGISAALVWLVATALPATTHMQITQESVETLMHDMHEVYLTGDSRKVEGFLTHHLDDAGTYAMTVRYTVPAMRLQQKPQTRSLSKSDFISQTVEGMDQVRQYRYELKLSDVSIDTGGKKATVTIATGESGMVPHPMQKNTQLRLNSNGTCTLELKAQIGLPAIRAMDCNMQTVMR